MRYKPYPKYKDSGVEWLGKIPEGWSQTKGRFAYSLITEKTDQVSTPIALENIEAASGKIIETETEFSSDGIPFLPGYILFGKLRPYLAKVWLATFSGQAVGDFFVLKPEQLVDSEYLKYLLLSEPFIAQADGSTFGAKMPRVDWQFMADFRFPLPPLCIQRSIAVFLDRETSKLDALVAETEGAIALLKEHRSALISDAVTGKIDVERLG